MQATSGSLIDLGDFQLIDLSYGGRTLQMRPSQLTTSNIAQAFRLIPETIILVYEHDTVALPQDGIFHDVDDCYSWTVEGEKATTSVSVAARGSRKASGVDVFPPTLPGAIASSFIELIPYLLDRTPWLLFPSWLHSFCYCLRATFI